MDNYSGNYDSGGGGGGSNPAYTPAMMKFDGSTGYYTGTFTSAGNLVTGIFRFKRASFTGGGAEFVYQADGPSDKTRIGAIVYSSDHASADRQNKLLIVTQNSAGVNICRLLSINNVMDDIEHTVLYAFNGDTGDAVFYIDGIDADDVSNSDRIAPVTGTLESGALSGFGIANLNTTLLFNGEIGFCGYHDAYLTDVSDFMDASGNPKELDEATWSEWVTQPHYWNEHGEGANNFGSASNMTKVGTIVVGKGGN